MSQKAIKYQKGFKYQLAEDYLIQIPIKPQEKIIFDWFSFSVFGNLLIMKGYAWDGPSGPTIDTANFMRGSLVHDVLYQMIRLGLLSTDYKDAADRLLQQMCIEDGMSKIRAWYVYRGVKRFAESATKPSSERLIYSAP